MTDVIATATEAESQRFSRRKKSLLVVDETQMPEGQRKTRRASMMQAMATAGIPQSMLKNMAKTRTFNDIAQANGIIVLPNDDPFVEGDDCGATRVYGPAKNVFSEYDQQVEGHIRMHQLKLQERDPSVGLRHGEELLGEFSATRPLVKNSAFRIIVTSERYIRMAEFDTSVIEARDLKDIIAVETDPFNGNVLNVTEFNRTRKDDKGKNDKPKKAKSFFGGGKGIPKTLASSAIQRSKSRPSGDVSSAKPTVDIDKATVQGWVEKKQGWKQSGSRRNWAWRYCALRNGILYFFKSEREFHEWDEAPQPSLLDLEVDLRQFVEFIATTHKTYGIGFLERDTTDSFQIAFGDEPMYDQWCALLQSIVALINWTDAPEEGEGGSGSNGAVPAVPEQTEEQLIESAKANRGLVLQEGFLFHKQSGVRRNWLRRYCVVRDGHLFLYKENEDGHGHAPSASQAPIVTLHLAGCDFSSDSHKVHGMTLNFAGSVSHNFAAENSSSYSQWCSAVQDGAVVANALQQDGQDGQDDADTSDVRTIQFRLETETSRDACVYLMHTAKTKIWQEFFEKSVVAAPHVYQSHIFCDMYDEKGKLQRRVFVLSTGALYNTDIDMDEFQLRSVVWAAPMSSLKGIISDPTDDCGWALDVDKPADAVALVNPLAPSKPFAMPPAKLYVLRMDSEFERRLVIAELVEADRATKPKKPMSVMSHPLNTGGYEKKRQNVGERAAKRQEALSAMAQGAVLVLKTAADSSGIHGHGSPGGGPVHASPQRADLVPIAQAAAAAAGAGGAGDAVAAGNTSASAPAPSGAASTSNSGGGNGGDSGGNKAVAGSTIVKAGWLDKKGAGALAGFKKRWIVVTKETDSVGVVTATVSYAKTENGPPIDVIPLSSYTMKRGTKKLTSLDLAPIDPTKSPRVYQFNAPSTEVAGEWIEAVSNVKDA